MRRAFVLLMLCGAAFGAAPNVYAPLWLYDGSWKVMKKDGSTDALTNKCAQVGRYFTCEQTVNGAGGALLILIPVPGKPSRYYVQNVRPEGRASSRGDLEIEGDHWVFTNTWDQGGSTVYYRTTNVFTGKTKIHYEQAESTDNKTWTVKASGDEVKITGR